MHSLFESDDDDIVPDKIVVNKSFANHYSTYRKKEEFQKLKSRYGDIPISDENSSSSSEEEITADSIPNDQFLKVMTALCNKDPSIYERENDFFPEKDFVIVEPKSKVVKPMHIEDYQRKIALGGDLNEEKPIVEDEPETYVEEQTKLKNEIQLAAIENDSSDEEFLTKRVKSESELKKESIEYQQWLEENKSKFSENDNILLDFIVNKKYHDSDDEIESVERIPTYSQIIDDDERVSTDEEFVDQQELHEKSYNFRFEEPGGIKIKSHPRKIDSSLRANEQSKRSEERLRKKELLEQKKLKRSEELKRLKQLKRNEISERIQKLTEIADVEKFPGMSVEQFDDDFDLEKHDVLMKSIFNDDYYNQANDDDEEKPEFSDQELEFTNEEYNKSTSSNVNSRETTDIIKKNKIGAELKKSLDEYYKLDYEDVIADGEVKCRFPYRQVEKCSYGLSAGAILAAPEKELNAWVSVKKMSQFRSKVEEERDRIKYERKAKNIKNVEKILPGLLEAAKESQTNVQDNKRRIRSKAYAEKAKNKFVTDERLKSYGVNNASKFWHYYYKSSSKPMFKHKKAKKKK